MPMKLRFALNTYSTAKLLVGTEITMSDPMFTLHVNTS
jgi:hypothetical protein